MPREREALDSRRDGHAVGVDEAQLQDTGVERAEVGGHRQAHARLVDQACTREKRAFEIESG